MSDLLGNFHPLVLAANTRWHKESGSIVVTSTKSEFPDLSFQTIRLSCASDPYRPGKDNYAGFILFGLKSDRIVTQDWWLNGKHCKSAYLVIQDTDSEGVKRYIGKAPGQVHGAVYWNVFGEGADVTKAIGEGFAWRNGELRLNSATFNIRKDSNGAYHDGEKVISKEMEKCVGKILVDWRDHSSLGKTYKVKDLLD